MVDLSHDGGPQLDEPRDTSVSLFASVSPWDIASAATRRGDRAGALLAELAFAACEVTQFGDGALEAAILAEIRGRGLEAQRVRALRTLAGLLIRTAEEAEGPPPLDALRLPLRQNGNAVHDRDGRLLFGVNICTLEPSESIAITAAIVRTVNAAASEVERPPAAEPLHLVTQDGQTYGSVRRCCERCGRMCWPGMEGSAKRWTSDPDTFAAAADRCDRPTGEGARG